MQPQERRSSNYKTKKDFALSKWNYIKELRENKTAHPLVIFHRKLMKWLYPSGMVPTSNFGIQL